MNPLSKYKNTNTAIAFNTLEEAKQLDKWLVEIGGRETAYSSYSSYGKNAAIDMTGFPYNCQCYREYFEQMKHYNVIHVSSILEPQINNSYEII